MYYTVITVASLVYLDGHAQTIILISQRCLPMNVILGFTAIMGGSSVLLDMFCLITIQ